MKKFISTVFMLFLLVTALAAPIYSVSAKESDRREERKEFNFVEAVSEFFRRREDRATTTVSTTTRNATSTPVQAPTTKATSTKATTTPKTTATTSTSTIPSIVRPIENPQGPNPLYAFSFQRAVDNLYQDESLGSRVTLILSVLAGLMFLLGLVLVGPQYIPKGDRSLSNPKHTPLTEIN
jgi:hypothetical protein